MRIAQERIKEKLKQGNAVRTRLKFHAYALL